MELTDNSDEVKKFISDFIKILKSTTNTTIKLTD